MFDYLPVGMRATMVAGGIALILSGVLLFYYRHAKGLIDEIWAVDTYRASELRKMCSDGFNAVVEVEGNISCENPITAPVSHFPCVWCRTTVERQMAESAGRGSAASRRLVWREGYDTTLTTVFKVVDETGYTLVDPNSAEIETEKPYQIITDERQPWFDIIGFSDTGFYRITEEILVPTGYVYVLGEASCTAIGPMPDALIHYPNKGYTNPNKPYFIISRKSEKQITQSSELSLKMCLYGGVLGLFFTAYCILSLLGLLP